MTVTGTIIGPDMEPVANRVLKFLPIRTPVQVGTSVAFTKGVSATTNEDGEFSVTLAPGIYRVDHRLEAVLENQEGPIFIRVSSADGPTDWTSLIRGMNQDSDFGGVAGAVETRYVLADDGSLWQESAVRQGNGFTWEQTLISEAP